MDCCALVSHHVGSLFTTSVRLFDLRYQLEASQVSEVYLLRREGEGEKKHRGPGPGAQLPPLTVENVEMETSPDAPLFTFYE